MDLATILALKMELITGQRKGEVISIRWDELDLKKDILELSKEKLANEIWVFPSPSIKNNTHISEMAVNKAVYRGFSTIDRSKEKKPITPLFIGIDKFTPHDLRRTAASHMTGLGIPRLVVSKILNHVENTVTAIYDRHTYEKEKQQALDTWPDKLEELTR